MCYSRLRLAASLDFPHLQMYPPFHQLNLSLFVFEISVNSSYIFFCTLPTLPTYEKTSK